MSFFKKLTTELKELIGDKDEKPKQDAPTQHRDGNRDAHAPMQPCQQQYTGPPQHGYGGPPPDQLQLPPGWIRQWDQNSQRWYFIEQATGRSQWDPPQFGHTTVPYYAPNNQHYPPHGMSQYDHEHEKSKKSGKGGMMAAGAGGLAVGALAGAALAGNSSGDERGHTYTMSPSGYSGGSVPPPVALENNPGLSSSQRSSLEEARKDYETAQREVAEDSDPSSSDLEELQEAREEYHCEVESAHEELED